MVKKNGTTAIMMLMMMLAAAEADQANDQKNVCADYVSSLSSSLPGYILRAVCPQATLYLPVRYLLSVTCTAKCKCEPILIDPAFQESNVYHHSKSLKQSTSWSPVDTATKAEGWRFPAIYIGNATWPNLDKRWTSQVSFSNILMQIASMDWA
jgi:hypothetical protein